MNCFFLYYLWSKGHRHRILKFNFFTYKHLSVRKADKVSLHKALCQHNKHLNTITTRRSPILILTHQLLLNFNYRPTNFMQSGIFALQIFLMFYIFIIDASPQQLINIYMEELIKSNGIFHLVRAVPTQPLNGKNKKYEK